MPIKFQCLLAVALLAAPIIGRAADSPPTYTTTTTEPAKPAPSGRAAAASQAPTAAEAAAGARTLQNLDLLIKDLTAALSKTEQCFVQETSLKNDLARKKAQLSAEFNGKIPAAFNDLLFQKSERITKQHKTCFQGYDALGRQFGSLDTAFGTIEPKSLNVKRQRGIVDGEKQRYLLMMPTAKPYNKAPKAKAGAN